MPACHRFASALLQRTLARDGRCLLAMLLIAVHWAGAAHAAVRPVEGLYGTTVTLLPEETAPSRETARRALTQVLLKVTGLHSLTGVPAADPVLARAQQLVQQQGFQSRRALRYVFDSAAVRSAALNAGLPYWDDDRPLVIVWLDLAARGGPSAFGSATDAAGAADAGSLLQQTLGTGAPAAGGGWLSVQDEGEPADVLRASAERRGIPLALPIMDAVDRAALAARRRDPAEVELPTLQTLTPPPDPLLTASRRYEADFVLVGEALPGRPGDPLRVRWRLAGEPQIGTWEGPVEAGPEYAADIMASRFATFGGGAIVEIQLVLRGLASTVAYTRTMGFFERLDLVERSRVTHVRRGELHLRVASGYQPSRLARLLELAGFLVRVREDGQQGGDYTFTYVTDAGVPPGEPAQPSDAMAPDPLIAPQGAPR